MKTLLGFAHAGKAASFGAADMVEHLAAISCLNPLARCLRQRFARAKRPLDTQRLRVNAHCCCFLGDIEEVGWGAAHGICLELDNLVDPSLGREGTARDHLTAQFFCSVVCFPECYIYVVSEGEKNSVSGTESSHIKDMTP